ncbi:MAG: hypothetical protein IKB04_03045 [Clostridia bacterium]|nr:hypothetical protein [Clostridia bacterium]
MYNEENGRRRQNASKSEQQSYRRYNARIAARKRRQRQRMLTIVGLIVVIAVIAVISIFLFKPSDTKNDPTKADALSGAWMYDQYTKYEFDGYGKGCMCLSDTHYEYSYKINGNTLSMDFENEAVHDCSYTFSVKDNTLTIVGGEGTSGGTYKLNKE